MKDNVVSETFFFCDYYYYYSLKLPIAKFQVFSTKSCRLLIPCLCSHHRKRSKCFLSHGLVKFATMLSPKSKIQNHPVGNLLDSELEMATCTNFLGFAVSNPNP
jgi:hypothetical protein